MDAHDLAAFLDGSTYGEFPQGYAKRARECGLLVVTGYSDDVVEFSGAFFDEAYPGEGGEVRFDRTGLVPSREAMEDADDGELEGWLARKRACAVLYAAFGAPGEPDWSFRTDVPHAPFLVMDEGRPYARGMVIAAADLPSMRVSR